MVLTEAAGRLVADANQQGRFAVTSDARDVQSAVVRLRQALGLS